MAGSAWAQSGPTTLTHHGYLTADGNAVEGRLMVRFELLAGDDNEVIYFEEQEVMFQGGYYAALLGTQESNGIPENLGSYDSLSIQVSVIDEGGDVILGPPQPLTAVPFAFASRSIYGGPVVASTLSVLKDGVETPIVNAAGEWAGPALTGSNIAANSISSAQIAEGAINSSHILDNSVTSEDIQDGTISIEDLKDEIVSTPKIQNEAVTADKIGTGAVTSDAINTNAVQSFHIADNAVSSADIANGSIRAEDVRGGGGIYASRADIYVATNTTVLSPSEARTLRVTCADANDLPLQLACPLNSAQQISLVGVDVNDWSDDSVPAEGACQLRSLESSLDRSVTAKLVCITVD